MKEIYNIIILSLAVAVVILAAKIVDVIEVNHHLQREVKSQGVQLSNTITELRNIEKSMEE